MPEDRLKKDDKDRVETLGDLIHAREERDSGFADDVDALADVDLEHVPFDPGAELTYPHKHGPSEEHLQGLDADLMDTPHERDVSFDWQDSAEEMLPTDPDSDEGFGEDETIEDLARIEPDELSDPGYGAEPEIPPNEEQ